MSVLSLIPEEKKKCIQSSETIYSGNSLKFSCIVDKRRILHPLLNSMAVSNEPNGRGSGGDKYITKRVLSAKDHKLKQLQNKLADAHFHLSELSNENRLLRSLQKRQELALQKYEGSNGDIPKMINSHTEEVRSWQVRHKQLRAQFRDTTQKLKERDSEYNQLHDEHKHLTALSKDANLGEREKLQFQVLELTEKVKKQDELISTLQRRITLEAKNLKHQLNVELGKHKETQLQLTEAQENYERLAFNMELKEKSNVHSMSRRILPSIHSAGHLHKSSFHSPNFDTETKNKSGPFLTVKANSLTESNNSSETNVKSVRSSKSSFSMDEKSSHGNIYLETISKDNDNYKNYMKNHRSSSKTENESSADSNTYDNEPKFDLHKSVTNGIPSIKTFESDTDLPKSSDEDVKERIEVLRKKLARQNISKETISEKSFENDKNSSSREDLPSKSKSNSKSTSEDSSTEERKRLKDTKPFKKNVKRRPVKSAKLTDVNEHEIDNTLFSSMSNAEKELQQILDRKSDLDKSWKEIEQIAGLEKNEAERVLDSFCDEIVQRSEINNDNRNTSHINTLAKVEIEKSLPMNESNISYKPGIFSKQVSHDDYYELNNNIKTQPRRIPSELNDEKKKKLLAALKAIDTGEDDGLNFDSFNKSRSKPTTSDSLSKNSLK